MSDAAAAERVARESYGRFVARLKWHWRDLAAAWSLTNSLRAELRSQGTQVVGVHVGFMDTDMGSGIDMPKADPLDVARQTLMAMADGKDEVLADDLSRQVTQGLSAGANLA